MPPKKPPARSVRKHTVASKRARRVDVLADALLNFTFPSSPDAFAGPEDGCTEVIVVDEHVRQARRVLGPAYQALACKNRRAK